MDVGSSHFGVDVCPRSLKLNFDGSSEGNLGLAGFGCVVRDCHGSIVCVIAGSIGSCDSTKAESMELLMGLRELKNLKFSKVSVEGDSLVVIGWELGKSNGL